MDDCDWLLSVEKACDWLRIELGVTGKFFLGHPVFTLMTSVGERARCDSVPGTISALARGASGRSRGEARKLSVIMWGWEKLQYQ